MARQLNAPPNRFAQCALVLVALAAQLIPLVSHAATGRATPVGIELHERLVESASAHAPTVALTLDACGGDFDRDVVDFLIERRIPATIFATRKWLDRNPEGLHVLLAHRELFEIEDHGANHVPALIGAGRKVYGIAGEPDVAHLRSEVEAGADAVASATGVRPHWYRAAAAMYDEESLQAIAALGYRVAGFSLNADAGATLPRGEVAARVRAARDGDIILAHVNKPRTEAGEGLIEGLGTLCRRGYRFVQLGDARLAPSLIAARR
ncbi:MAG TPA: polysaccharide deacetylase family protein [Burkholderiaceae bacterium]|nr:polysaccharide deacetylase family protein [Burkholderiaceae bacterium]